MRLTLILLAGVICFRADAQSLAGRLWADLEAKRDKLPSFHQEFDFSRSFRTSHGDQASTRKLILDMAPGVWREKWVDGSGSTIRLFDGEEMLDVDEGSGEFTRAKAKGKKGSWKPMPYSFRAADWTKAVEINRASCGIPSLNHQCVVLEVPLKAEVEQSSHGVTKRLPGKARVVMDLETGLLISSQSIQPTETDRDSYETTVKIVLKLITFGGPAEQSLFKLSEGELKEVKQITRWDANRIKKKLAGRPAPLLEVKDIRGNAVNLAALKGKTVLLDFWTTWCPPCRADSPMLDKLYTKYGGNNLMIISFSVSEERQVVEKFLQEHSHAFPVVLTSENEMPRPYQIGVFPTYIVIDPDGNVNSASEGEQGFGELRRLLKKAGLETE